MSIITILWLFFTSILSELAAVLAVVAAILGSVIAITISIKKIYKQWVKINTIFETIERVAIELQPNGGTSIKDAINRMEKRQIWSEQKDKALLQNNEFGVFESDNQGFCIWVNKTYTKLVQRTFEDMKNQGWLSHVAGEDREYVKKEWDAAVKDRREFDLNYRFITPTGNINVRVHALPLFDGKDQLLGYVGTVNKIN